MNPWRRLWAFACNTCLIFEPISCLLELLEFSSYAQSSTFPHWSFLRSPLVWSQSPEWCVLLVGSAITLLHLPCFPLFSAALSCWMLDPVAWLAQNNHQDFAVGWISEPQALIGVLLVCFVFVEFTRGCCNFTQMRSPSPSLALAPHFPWCLVAWQLLEFLSSREGSKVAMNYIFGNSTLYPRGGRANTGTAHSAPGPKQRQWAKRSSSEELPSSSRWQQLLAFFTRRNAFSDCITAGAGQVNSTMPTTCCRDAYHSARCVGMFITSTLGWCCLV